MSSTCNEFNELLLDLAYDELDAPTSNRLLQHKDQCASCQKAWGELMGVRNVARHYDPPTVPDHFDSDILALARKTAESFTSAQTNDRRAGTSVPAPVLKPPSLLEKIQAFILRPAIIGTGLAAAAVLIAVTTIKNDAHNTMMEPVNGAPFVGGKPVAEPDALPSADKSEAKANLQTKVQKSEAAAEDNTVPAAPERIQKAGPDYEPLYRQQAAEADRKSPLGQLKTARSETENSVAESKSATPRINKNPDNLLQQKSAKGSLSNATSRGPASHMDDIGVSKTAPTSVSKKKSAASYTSQEESLSAMEAPAPSRKSGAANGEMDAAPSTAAESERDDIGPSTFESGLAAYNRGDCKTAIALFSAYVDAPVGSGENVPMATHYIARCEKRTGRCGKAVIHYEQLLNQFSTYSKRADALYEAAQCHQKLGHGDRAQTLLEELSLDPDWRAKAQKMMSRE
ncbi:MAG: tetratricopeptide repeat protein [Deltaproteobacteria bacterium]|nr:tetratricopeptide repeat protein [Deltaproteobacteria bacterium]